jgi:glycosyltransferase involved in cell wall biosynthesis
VTPADKDSLQELVPSSDIQVLPNAHEIKDRGKIFNERNGLFFIGSFVHRPNLDAIEFFLSDIFPLIVRQHPEIRLHIVGSNMPAEIASKGSNNVVVHGFVADPAEFFRSCRVFVCPLRYGAGMKGKIGHALSHGLPVVTTSIGAEGMGLHDGQEVLIADDPQSFADAVLKAYCNEDVWDHLSRTAHRFLEQNFSDSVVGDRLEQVIKKMLTDGDKGL